MPRCRVLQQDEQASHGMPVAIPLYAGSALAALEVLTDDGSDGQCCESAGGLGTSCASSDCHFELPGLLDDFTGGSCLDGFVPCYASPLAASHHPAVPAYQQWRQPGATPVDPVFGTEGGLREVLR